MDFNHFLTSYMPDPTIGSKTHFKNMLDQSVLAEQLGYVAVSIPEHHLVNVLMMPSPLQMAVKISTLTNKIRLSTSVVVLPIHDMRTFAGDVSSADILTEGRLELGVARGAFAWELDRLGSPIESSKEKFIESLAVLELLLSKENVSFKGKYYNFEPITIMPRPISDPVPIMIAAMNLNSIRDAASKGYHVQSTVLSGTKKLLLERVNAFKEGQNETGEKGKLLRLSMQRMAYAAKDEQDAKDKNLMAYEYYKRFDNMFTGPGKINKGLIEPLPRLQTLEEMTENLIICPVHEMIDKLSVYAESGINEIIISAGFGQSQQDMIDSMYRIGEYVIPHFKSQKSQVA